MQGNKHANGDHGENMIAVLTNNERKFVMVDYDHTSSPPNSPLKHCLKCGETKPCAAFSKDKSKRDGLQLYCKQCNAQYHSANADKISERQARYYRENADKVRKNVARYGRENPAKERERKAKYRSENPDKKRAADARWRQANLGKKRAAEQRRRATKRALPVQWSDADAQRMLAYWKNCCAICNQHVEPNNAFYILAADHWIALTDPRPGNPGTVPCNVLPLCHSKIGNALGCNSLKYNADPIEWLHSRYPDDPKLVAKILARIAKYFKFIETDGAQ